MFILLRRIENWLHQHVFKVGWLSTHDYQTTTILYYTFFMPGVILHELVYYLAAGVFNVRAERDIKWPDKQEIGELKLNFVKLAPRTSPFRKALVTSMPLLVGLICIWAIANYIFDITSVVERMSSGELTDIVAAFNLLIGAPLFWLWIYIIFTIANTMFPNVPKDLKGWRSVLIGLGVVALALFLVGIGGELFEVLQAPLSQIISVLQATFVLIMCVDILMVLALGTIEYTIEHITGHSATFRGNRMYTMTREEALEEREKARERERKRLEREARRKASVDNSPISIYTMVFSVPGAPGDVPITQLEAIEVPEEEIEEVVEEPTSPRIPSFGGLAEDKKEEKPLTDEQKRQQEAIAARINLPEPRSPLSEPDETEEDDEPKQEPTLTSRFGIRQPIAEPEDEDVEDEGTEQEPTPTSRFGIRAPDRSKVTENSEDNNEPITSDSRFGIRQPSTPKPSQDNEESDETKTPVEEQKPAAASRFGIQPPSKPIRKPRDEDEEIEDEDKEQEPTPTSHFGIRPFGKPTAEDDGEDDETVRVVGRPASPSRLADEEEDDDDSLLRRGRGDDAVANLFGQLGSGDDEDDSPEIPLRTRGTIQFGNRFGKLSDTDDEENTSSRFGTSRFARGQSSQSEEDEDDNEPSSSRGIRNFKPSAPVSSRFGSSRPAPKPVSSTDEDDEDLLNEDDEIVYEDIEDEYYDYDDEEYIDYDDDDY